MVTNKTCNKNNLSNNIHTLVSWVIAALIISTYKTTTNKDLKVKTSKNNNENSNNQESIKIILKLKK